MWKANVGNIPYYHNGTTIYFGRLGYLLFLPCVFVLFLGRVNRIPLCGHRRRGSIVVVVVGFFRRTRFYFSSKSPEVLVAKLALTIHLLCSKTRNHEGSSSYFPIKCTISHCATSRANLHDMLQCDGRVRTGTWRTVVVEFLCCDLAQL